MQKEAVILIHGMGRTHRSMRKLETFLKSKGYITYNRSYPSTVANVERSAVHYINSALATLAHENISKVHFVTHSLGGLLVRYFLSNHQIKKLGRVVMLAPPNQGSEVAERYQEKFWYKWITGVPGQQLQQTNNRLLRDMKPLKTEVGIIAGIKSSDPWFNHVFQYAHDGKVSVEGAKLPEMTEMIKVPHGHTFIMNKTSVKNHIANFLASGNFFRPSPKISIFDLVKEQQSEGLKSPLLTDGELLQPSQKEQKYDRDDKPQQR
ncbi:alpha/beta fold hydrolase [Kangiella sediminilitoris]|uniref:alpha/beta fold hydrolase n=1 Tax=Kangiella sediminilitoris TaxID=1144748 RepID=UPI00083D20D1|nr:alpha/beta fold hydrolase [Kangiella sediminilitoris]